MTNFIKNLLNNIKRWGNSLRDIFSKTNQAKKADPELALKQVIKARKSQLAPTKAQIKHLPKLLSKTEKHIATVAIVLIAISSILLGRQLLNSQRTVVPAVGGEYTEGLIGAPQLINPIYSLNSDVDNDLSHLIYSGLMKYDTTDGLVPDLAESYTISEDETIYTFVLKDNAKWHDGKPVLADDIVFTISAIQNQDYRSPLQLSFSEVKVNQIDDRTVSFTLTKPFTPFLSFLTVGILPSHLWQEVAPFNATLTELNKKPIGSGPYIFKKLIRDSNGNIRSYELTRNQDFYNTPPYISTITFKFYSDITAGISALKNHNVESLSYVPTNELHLFEKDNSINLVYTPLRQYTALFFNKNNNSILETKSVRQALALGTDKNQIINDVLLGHGAVIDTFILSGMLGSDSDIIKYENNLDEANQLLTDNGWIFANEDETTNLSQFRSKDGKTLELEIVTLDSEELKQVADNIKTQWKKLGVKININVVSITTLQSDILKNRNYDILLSGERYSFDTDPYAFWHSSQTDYPGLNLTLFKNSDADDYIESGRTTTDIEKRTEYYQKLQEIIATDIPAVFLYQPDYTYATSNKIKGIIIDGIVSPADRFSKITDWHIKTRKIFSTSKEVDVNQN